MTTTTMSHAELTQWMDEMEYELSNPFDCLRCNDERYIPAFSHVDSGRCFECWYVKNSEQMAAAKDEPHTLCGMRTSAPDTDCWRCHAIVLKQEEERLEAEAEAFAETMREKPCSYWAHTDANHSGCHLLK